MTRTAAVIGLGLCIWLTGCAGPAATVAPPARADTTIARAPAAAIDLAGRLSVRYQKDGHDEALHGSFTWLQRSGATVVSLLSPLGQTLAVITIAPTTVSIEQSGQTTRTASEPNALVADILGWPLPVAGLGDWLQGFVSNAQGQRSAVTANDTMTLHTADGWSLHYAAWDNSDPTQPHPKRIDLTRRTAEAGEVAIRLAIDSWQPQQPAFPSH